MGSCLRHFAWTAVTCIAVDAVSAAARDTRPVQACIASAASTLPENVATTLHQIEGIERRLLALRSYLRNRDALAASWSWSDARIEAFERSAEFRVIQAELAKITSHFETANPGYTLYVNSRVRSLDAQIRKWNENEAVGAVAKELMGTAQRHIRKRGRCLSRAHEHFAQHLIDWRPRRPPPLAAPGLSKHGQVRAFDFQVQRGSKIVAGTSTIDSAAVWDRWGWTAKLQKAVSAASSRFSGPLLAPYEPWHYEYDPSCCRN